MSRASGISGKHFRGPSRRSQKHRRDAQFCQCTDYGRDCRSLTGTRITIEYQYVTIISGKKFGHLMQERVLGLSRLVLEMSKKLVV